MDEQQLDELIAQVTRLADGVERLTLTIQRHPVYATGKPSIYNPPLVVQTPTGYRWVSYGEIADAPHRADCLCPACRKARGERRCPECDELVAQGASCPVCLTRMADAE